MVKVVAAAGSKHRASLDCEHTFYDPPSNKAGPWTSKLARTNRFKHLDKATLSVDPSELDTHGLTEAFAAVAVMEYFTTQMPDSMRTVAGAIFHLSLSITSYLSSLLVNVIHAITGSRGWSPWLGGHDLNKNRLDYYFHMIAILETHCLQEEKGGAAEELHA
ncbi:hypothetical protein AAG906_001320 [Vitis piasezkii]